MPSTARLANLFLLLSLLAGEAGAASSLVVEVDAASDSGVVQDLFGVNRRPGFTARNTGGAALSAANLYAAFGVSQLRTHDTGLDLCGTYTAARGLDLGTTPAQSVAGCELAGTGGIPTFDWTPTSSAPSDLDNPAHYDFGSADTVLAEAAAAGSALYLRLGESYNGPNHTSDPVAWAQVAANLYRHVIGAFKPTPGLAAVDPVYVEVHNEPDGAFWRGTAAEFHALFRETVTRVRAAAAAAAAAGRTVRVGGAGFTRSVLSSSGVATNPASGFIAAVGAGNLDFYSAHHYGTCASATLTASAGFLRSLRALVDGQGGTGMPIHVTEWNIGLGNQCGNALYAEPRMQSWTSGVLTLMQDPAQRIEAAHFYSGVPVMPLFDLSTTEGVASVNPSAWAFWAHGRLRGATRLATQVCVGTTCRDGHAAETLPLLSLAARRDALTSVVLTNDGNSAQVATLRLRGLAAPVDVALRTPPAGPVALPVGGSPAQADAAALRALLSQPAVEHRRGLAPAAGVLELDLSVPARGLLVVELRPADSVTAQADCLLDWGERAYADLMRPPLRPSVTNGDVHYRHYPGTQSYVGISIGQRRLLYMEARDGRVRDLGSLQDWLATAGCG